MLCKDGSRRSINDYRSCHWGVVPANAIVTSSAKVYEDRRKYQKFLEKVAEIYAFNNTPIIDDYDRNRNEYDQFGDRNRFKRQNFDDLRNRNPNDPINRDEDRRDPYNRNNPNPFERDPFKNDPYSINRHEYGINIDPYNTQDTTYKHDSDSAFVNVESDHRNRNYSYYETFYIFESSPKYGIHGNLLFQVKNRVKLNLHFH